jgi:hypothetical protein
VGPGLSRGGIDISQRLGRHSAPRLCGAVEPTFERKLARLKDNRTLTAHQRWGSEGLGPSEKSAFERLPLRLTCSTLSDADPKQDKGNC